MYIQYGTEPVQCAKRYMLRTEYFSDGLLFGYPMLIANWLRQA